MIIILVVTLVIVGPSFFSSFFSASDSRHYTCQQNNDTGNIFLCQFSNECIKKVFPLPEVKNRRKTGNTIYLNQICDGRCECERYDNSEILDKSCFSKFCPQFFERAFSDLEPDQG